ncbi:MAG TPA: histidinol-phosphate transaminase [Candidatus Limnocylindria bacterium]|jgi:histidinol-phosphate aminotransferase
MIGDLPRPREWLTDATPYRTESGAAEVRLQSNEWTDPTPLARYLSSTDLEDTMLNRYPEIAAAELRTLLARRWSVAPEQIILGNGSNEVLLYTFLIFGGSDRTLLVFTPTYTMYARLGRLTGMRVHEECVGVPYTLDAAGVRDAVARVRPDVICFSSPNNPTGGLVDDAAILAACDAPRTLVLVDEAYAEFSGHSFLPRIADQANVVVARTFSKAQAAAGLRLGALVADQRIAAMYEAARLPYNVGILTQLVARRIVADDAGLAERVSAITHERARVARELQNMPEVEAFPSAANFVLFRHSTLTATVLHAALLERSVLVRDVSSWPDAGESLRATIGSRAENDRLLDALRAVLAERGR